MINLARDDNDWEDVLAREESFQWAGRLLGLHLAGRDVSELPGLDFDVAAAGAPKHLASAAAYGYLAVGLAYNVDIAVDLGRDYLDHGQLEDHLTYAVWDSGLNLDQSDLGTELLEDENWVESACAAVLSKHWQSLVTLAEEHWCEDISDDVLRAVLALETPSRWVAQPNPSEG